jgi:hypothetical protein
VLCNQPIQAGFPFDFANDTCSNSDMEADIRMFHKNTGKVRDSGFRVIKLEHFGIKCIGITIQCDGETKFVRQDWIKGQQQ